MKIDIQLIAIFIAIVTLTPVFIWQTWVRFKEWRDIGKPPAKPEIKPPR